MKKSLPFIIILAVAVVGIGAGWYMTRKPETPTPVGPPAVNPPATSNANPSNASSTPVAVANVNEPGAEPPHAIGPADAPVVLEEFGDFQCPPCGALHPELQKIEHQYGSKVRVIFRQFPLVPTHAHALTAARATEAAGMQGKFWQMHAMIFETQRAWDKVFDVRPVFESYAQKIGLDVEKWKRDLTSATVERRIFLDGKRAHALGVKGTPTLYLNGREVPFDSLPAARLSGLIDAELARLGR